MNSTLKVATLLILSGTVLYLFFSVFGLSIAEYRHVVSPSLSKRVHPFKKALKANETFDLMNAFYDIYYDPYDLYI